MRRHLNNGSSIESRHSGRLFATLSVVLPAIVLLGVFGARDGAARLEGKKPHAHDCHRAGAGLGNELPNHLGGGRATDSHLVTADE